MYKIDDLYFNKVKFHRLAWGILLSVGNGDFNIHTWLNLNGSLNNNHKYQSKSIINYNLSHGHHGTSKVDNALMNGHLETVPGFTTFTTGSLAGSNFQSLGGHSDWPTNLNILL